MGSKCKPEIVFYGCFSGYACFFLFFNRGYIFDELVKSPNTRHSGENRSPGQLYPFDITGFRFSPE